MKSIVSLILVGTLVLFSTGCTPAQETQIINDIGDVVNFATSILSIIQAFGPLDTPQEQADVALATQYASELSAAASKAVVEANSTDPWNTKVTTIAGYFAPIVPPNIATPKIMAAVQLATSAVKLLLDQLGVASAQAQSLDRHQTEVNLAGSLPFTATHKLGSIKKQADKNVMTANEIMTKKGLKR